jgi:hypothetical protein
MSLPESAVFYVLLERSDNDTCAIPLWMTPSLVQLAEAVHCSKSAAGAPVLRAARNGPLPGLFLPVNGPRRGLRNGPRSTHKSPDQSAFWMKGCSEGEGKKEKGPLFAGFAVDR